MSANERESEYRQCPYEKSHLIMESRFQVHLVKCRKNHRNVPKVQCPFNSTHLLNDVELDYHVTVCPQRTSFEMFRMENQHPGIRETEEPDFPEPLQTTENWDDANWNAAPVYKPRVASASSNVLRSIQGATPSERKRFREEEHRRLIALRK